MVQSAGCGRLVRLPGAHDPGALAVIE